jgi:hypothetical protein
VFTWPSSVLSAVARAIQLPSPPPIDPSAFSGPRLAPPISDTAETAAIPAPARLDAAGLQVVEQAGGLPRQPGQATHQPDRDPAATATATHHQCPPNQPGSESLYHLPPT